MRACWTRAATLVAAAVAALLLTGCEIEGSVDVVSSEQVALDLPEGMVHEVVHRDDLVIVP